MDYDYENNGGVFKPLVYITMFYMLCFVGCVSMDTLGDIADKYHDYKESESKGQTVSSDAQMFSELNFNYGGFNGSSASWDGSTEITNLNVGKNLTYQWVKGGCESLGASNATDASKTLACLFCKVNGVWVGGKFDWISTSRTSRDFKNIQSGYKGWDSSALDKASAYRFIIISSDGKRRTNVIEVTK